MKMDEAGLHLRLLLRSVYLKGHQDGNLKTSDMSWEDTIVKDILELCRKQVPGIVNANLDYGNADLFNNGWNACAKQCRENLERLGR